MSGAYPGASAAVNCADELIAGDRPPDPATLTHDADDLAGIAAAALDLDALPSEKIVNLLLETAGFRRFHLRRTEGHIRAALESHDGTSSTDFAFTLTKGISPEGRVRIEIARQRAGDSFDPNGGAG